MREKGFAPFLIIIIGALLLSSVAFGVYQIQKSNSSKKSSGQGSEQSQETSENISPTISVDLLPTETKTDVNPPLVPSVQILGNDFKKTDTFKQNNEDLESCPQDETVFFDTKDPFNKAKYAIMVKKCRSEQEAYIYFHHKTDSAIFSSTTPTYGDESVHSGSEDEISKAETIKFRVGIYYVDILGRNKDAQKEVVEDLAQKVADYL